LPEIFASLYDHDAATPKIPINLLRHGPESTPTRLGEISGLALRHRAGEAVPGQDAG